MTFDYGRTTHDLQQSISGLSPNFSMYATDANKGGKRDWFAEFIARANKNFCFGNSLGYNNNMKISSILQRLERE